MFRSRRRPVVFPQAEHARLAATLAQAWGNDEFPRPRLPFDAFVRGVARHDRGYGELDADEIGAVPTARWLELQRGSFEPRGDDSVVDLVVALHACRLVARHPRVGEAVEPLQARLPELYASADVAEPDAAAADRVTDLCDTVAFDFCLETAAAGAAAVSSSGAALVEIRYAVDGEGHVTLDPWPLAVPWLPGVALGYRADGYPDELEPVVVPYRVSPA